MADPLPFAQGVEVNDYRWTATAYDLMVAGQLVLTRRPPGRSVEATGRCPRCGHDVDYSFLPTISLPRGGPGTLGSGSGDPKGVETARPKDDARQGDASGHGGDAADQYDTVPILCQCHEDHPGRPKDGRGCGIVFNTELLGR
jgi:hypothetical protein